MMETLTASDSTTFFLSKKLSFEILFIIGERYYPYLILVTEKVVLLPQLSWGQHLAQSKERPCFGVFRHWSF